MKELWIEIPENASAEERGELFTIASEADATIVEGNYASQRKNKHDIAVVDKVSEVTLGGLKREGKKVALKIAIKGKEDENKAVEAAEVGADYVIIDCRDWRVIPLENIRIVTGESMTFSTERRTR